MTNVAVTNTFSSGTKIQSGQVNTNYSDITTWLNNRDNASDFWQNVKISATSGNPMECKGSSTTCEFDIDCTGTNGRPIVTWRRSGSTLFTAGVDGAASNLFKLGTSSITTNVALQIPSGGAQIQIAAGTLSAPGMCFIGDTNTGIFQSTSGEVRLGSLGNTNAIFGSGGTDLYDGSGNTVMNIRSTLVQPASDNTFSFGATGKKWTALWATNGTVQTCASWTKTNIEDVSPEEISVPRPIYFNRPNDSHSKPQLGFEADLLPEECFAVIGADGTRSKEDVYLSSVVGMLCGAARQDYQRLKLIESRLAMLEAK